MTSKPRLWDIKKFNSLPTFTAQYDFIDSEISRISRERVCEALEKVKPYPERNPYSAMRNRKELQKCNWWSFFADEFRETIDALITEVKRG